ncbi:MAG: shikimate kinase [Candidatus Hydrogenedentes bacterium]|nr:shikimate kinase [Candidatus Hydrogenedentota bacterium]
MNLILVGARGSGKSAVARELTRMLEREAISTDVEIERRANASIKDYVGANGWKAFRILESEVVRDLAVQENIVLDTGGGVVARAENIAMLRANGIVFWLKASVETLAARIKPDTNRPSLTGEKNFIDEIAGILVEREPLYTSAAHYAVVTENRTVPDIAREIAGIFAAALPTDQPKS